ncbi:transcriptional regulator [Sporosarcina thermotolerans]|uniref:Transcriptional regulator n=1 Tax=Sporosarcina thermotolerans TaxID=633404 RepID=A0AAW9A7P3_9BACL|nr:transcriptional regulator [Sporosarcina thermotolerans]MDW0116355.1 transcriptional regulator [Sporosarcina thermotolerans]WHT48319.1 transcriptional regulator [Sporosarcina thermotolerans]
MLSVQRMTPFFTSQEDFRLRLVFAYQYFSIIKGGEVYQFVPSEGKEIVVNVKSLQVENLGEVFVFQRGSKFIRLPLYQLLLISDLHLHLSTILEGTLKLKIEVPEVVIEEAGYLIEELEAEYYDRMIDYALETKNRSLFIQLTEGML